MRPSHRCSRRQRRGYAMLLVIVFLLILLSTLGLAYRQMATTLQLEIARTQQIDFEQGSLELASIGLGTLPTLSNGTTYYSMLPQTFTTSAGQKQYKLVMALASSTPASPPGATTETWTVSVTPE